MNNFKYQEYRDQLARDIRGVDSHTERREIIKFEREGYRYKLSNTLRDKEKREGAINLIKSHYSQSDLAKKTNDFVRAHQEELSNDPRMDPRYEMVRNLDLSKVEDYEFIHPAIGNCPKMDVYLSDKILDVREGILGLMDRVCYVKPGIEFIPNFELVNQDFNEELAKKNGSFVLITNHKKLYCYLDDDDVSSGKECSLGKLFGVSDFDSLLKIQRNILDEGGKFVYNNLKYRLTDLGTKWGYRFECNSKPIFPADDAVAAGLASGICVKFTYNGFHFKLTRHPWDNVSDLVIENFPDNKMCLQRMTTHVHLMIDDLAYTEIALCEKYPDQRRPAPTGLYDSSCQSWRKWLGLKDIVVDY